MSCVRDLRSLSYSTRLNDHPIRGHKLFYGYIRNITRWSNTYSLRHYYRWSNMGNIVGTLTWASRDRAFHSPPHPRIHYDVTEVQPYAKQILRLSLLGTIWTGRVRLFCEHNRAFCLSCGPTLIRFDAPDGHNVLEDIPSRRGVEQSKVGTISHYG